MWSCQRTAAGRKYVAVLFFRTSCVQHAQAETDRACAASDKARVRTLWTCTAAEHRVRDSYLIGDQRRSNTEDLLPGHQHPRRSARAMKLFGLVPGCRTIFEQTTWPSTSNRSAFARRGLMMCGRIPFSTKSVAGWSQVMTPCKPRGPSSMCQSMHSGDSPIDAVLDEWYVMDAGVECWTALHTSAVEQLGRLEETDDRRSRFARTEQRYTLEQVQRFDGKGFEALVAWLTQRVKQGLQVHGDQHERSDLQRNCTTGASGGRPRNDHERQLLGTRP